MLLEAAVVLGGGSSVLSSQGCGSAAPVQPNLSPQGPQPHSNWEEDAAVGAAPTPACENQVEMLPEKSAIPQYP